jgi:NADH dehydrogenase
MQGLVTVFGGSGFLGAQAVRALAKKGLRVRVAVRNPGRAYKMRMLGDVGQIEVVQANVRAPQSVARALAGAEACVNLVGVLYETGRQKFQSVHAMGSHNIAEVAAAVGVRRFVHVSALGSDPDSPSKYGRTKAMGEAAVRELVPTASIVKPSIVFGQGDGFFNKFGQLMTMSPVMPLIGGGLTRLQPVYVGDIASAVADAVDGKTKPGSIYELGGPEVLTMREIIEIIMATTGRERMLVSLPFELAKLQALMLQFAPGSLKLTPDQVELLRSDNVVSASAKEAGLSFEGLGIAPDSMEALIPQWLW